MEYANTVIVNHSCIVKAEDLEGIKPGDVFCNSLYSHKTDALLYDGGLDHKNDAAQFWDNAARRNIKAGRFIIQYNGRYYRYAVRPTNQTGELNHVTDSIH